MNYTLTPLNPDLYCTIPMAKKQLRIDADQTFEDDLIAEYRDSAIAQVENQCAVIFGNRDLEVAYTAFETKLILPVWPVKSITSVEYRDINGATQILAAADYKLFALQQDHKAHVTILIDLPETESDNPVAVTVTAVAGTDTVPGDIKQAIKLLISDSDTYREDKPMPGTDRSVMVKLRPYKY